MKARRPHVISKQDEQDSEDVCLELHPAYPRHPVWDSYRTIFIPLVARSNRLAEISGHLAAALSLSFGSSGEASVSPLAARRFLRSGCGPRPLP
jgi:hypothetical protein